MSPNVAICSNLNLVKAVRKNTRFVVGKMLLTTLRVAFTYVLSNLLYTLAAFYRNYVSKSDEHTRFYWLAVNFIILTHAVEILNLYSFDKDYRRVMRNQLDWAINKRHKKYSESKNRLHTTSTTVWNSQKEI